MAWFRRVSLAAFVVYTCALLVSTHWPRLVIHGPVERTDVVIHVFAFGLWTVLLGLSELVGRRWRLLLACGLAFALLDETTQPLFDRTFDWLDIAGNSLGIGLATLAMALVWKRTAPGDGASA
jgi:hypothetical protein